MWDTPCEKWDTTIISKPVDQNIMLHKKTLQFSRICDMQIYEATQVLSLSSSQKSVPLLTYSWNNTMSHFSFEIVPPLT